MLSHIDDLSSNSNQEIVEYYIQKAYQRAKIKQQDFIPSLGYKANLQIMHQLYYYYQEMYLLDPRFLWMGLARLTGGQVLWGMTNLIKIAKDPCVMSIGIVQIAKDIFEKMAWQHELFLGNYPLLIAVLKNMDFQPRPSFSFAEIWQDIKNGKPYQVANANLSLLFNEQNYTIQHHYEIIRADNYSRKYLFLTRFTMRQIHPYHHRFIADVPLKDVTLMRYRWQWISHKNGMWNTWVNLPEAERTRLIQLNNQEIRSHNLL